MIIRNINVANDLAKKVLHEKSFIEQIVANRTFAPKSKVFNEELSHSNLRDKIINWAIPEGQNFAESVEHLLHNIPIYLQSNPDNTDKDTLGAYYSGKGVSMPRIELHILKINGEANNKLEFRWLLAMTLLHELMHGVMDVYNQIDNYDTSGKYIGPQEQIQYTTDYGRWREESFANAGCLKLIHSFVNNYNKLIEDSIIQTMEAIYGFPLKTTHSTKNPLTGFYIYIKNYMEHQDPEYKLGVQLFHYKIDFSNRIQEKLKGVSQRIQTEWLYKAQGADSFTSEDLFKNFEKQIYSN